MEMKKPRYFLWILAVEAVGFLSGILSREGTDRYAPMANKPPLSPPGWVFPIVWTVLYLLMGEASWRVLTSGAESDKIRKALIAYGVQLGLNFLWSIVFFALGWYLAAFFVLIALWIMILLTIRAFTPIDETAGDLLIPYILWVTFAGYLNLGVYFLN